MQEFIRQGPVMATQPSPRGGVSSQMSICCPCSHSVGVSNNPYPSEDPASYHLNIHVLGFPDHKYDFPAG